MLETFFKWLIAYLVSIKVEEFFNFFICRYFLGRIRIRIRVIKIMVPDPDYLNSDPQYWLFKFWILQNSWQFIYCESFLFYNTGSNRSNMIDIILMEIHDLSFDIFYCPWIKAAIKKWSLRLPEYVRNCITNLHTR